MPKTVLSEDELELQELQKQVNAGAGADAGAGQVEEVATDEGVGASEPESVAEGETVERQRGPDGKFAKTVPHQALHEARSETKAEREARQKLERDFAEYKGKVEERLRFLMEARQQAEQPKAPAIPDAATDPIGHMQAMQAQFAAKLDEIGKGTAQTREQIVAQQRQASALAQLQAEEQRFAGTTPDYFAATDHLQQTWLAEAQAAGVTDPRIVGNFVRSRLAQIIEAAQMTNRSPAQVSYDLAKARGYVKAAPAGEQQSENTKLDNLKKGLAASKSLGAGAATQNGATPTVDWLLSLSEDEFDAYKTKHPTEYRRVMTGAA